MSMTHIPNLPPPRDRIADLLEENRKLRDEIADLREQLRRNKVLEEHEQRTLIRMTLSPLHTALTHLFEQIDTAGVRTISGDGPQKNSAAWESWKQKLGGKVAEAIDVLLLHGEMNAAQLRIHLRCATNYVFQVISKLHKAGLINKNGGKISLKQL